MSEKPAQLELKKLLPFRLEVLSDRISPLLAQTYEPFGLRYTEWVLLMTLGEVGTTTAATFRAHNRFDKTLVSRTVARLVTRRLVVRTKRISDLREDSLRLSSQGKHLYDRIVPLARECLGLLQNELPSEEWAALARGLGLLADRVKKIKL